MNVSRIADKSRPDYLIRRLKAVEDDVARLRTARSANAAKVDGTLTVAGDVDLSNAGMLTINKGGGTTIEASSTTDEFGNVSAQVVFHSRYGDGTTPASLSLQDGGNPYSSVVLQTAKMSGAQALLDLTPAFATLEALNGSSQATLNLDAVGQQAWIALGTTSAEKDVTFSPNFLELPNGRLTAASVPEWQARSQGGGSYVPMRASSFPTGSSRAVKRDVAPLPFDSLATITAAPAQSWRYRPEFAEEDLSHIGPMAEDLPAALVHPDPDGVASVDLLSLVGVLWDAVGRLSARVAQLGPPVTPPAGPVTK